MNFLRFFTDMLLAALMPTRAAEIVNAANSEEPDKLHRQLCGAFLGKERGHG